MALLEIIRLCPFSVATVVWGEHQGDSRLTIVVKGTFHLTHRGEAMLAPRQDTAHGDVSWDHNPQAALFAPSDYVPRKERIDIVFSGRTFAEGGDPKEIIIPRLRVGHFEKKVRVMGPRVWMQGGAGLRPSLPERFLAAPMRYELAAMQGENLSGIQTTAVATGAPLPRIECVEESPEITPGFGPLPVHWRAESRGATEDALSFARRLRLQPAIVPRGFDFHLFNCAPAEQQIEELEPAPVIQLDHLCRKFPHLETRLPRIRPRAFFANRSTDKPYEVDLKLDTLLIDGLRMVAVVSWRGTTMMNDQESYALGRIVVAAESPEMEVSLEDVEYPPVPQEDSSPRPILPRPFEGEIAEDEGYTLLPSRPVRAPVAFAESPQDPLKDALIEALIEAPKAASAVPPRHRDSSIPIPPSGERLIEDRSSTMLVDSAMPGPNELFERASLGQTPEDTQDYGLMRSPVASTPSTTARRDEELDDIDIGARTTLLALQTPPKQPVVEADDAPPPATERTGSVPPSLASAQDQEPPATPRNLAPESMPPTLIPSTRKTGTVAPPATSPSPGMLMAAATVELSPMTERTPMPRGFTQSATSSAQEQSEGVATELPLDTNAAVAVSSGSVPTSLQQSKVVSVDVPRTSSAGARKPAPSYASMPRVALAELPIELCASLTARIDRNPSERAQIFDNMGLSESTYVSSEQAWQSACRAEMEQARTELRATYERAYVAQLETERGELDIADYAHLMVNVELGDADAVLAELGLPRVGLVRIERVWQERMAADASFCARVRQVMAATRKALLRARRGLPAGPDSSATSTETRSTAFAEGNVSSRPRSSDR